MSYQTNRDTLARGPGDPEPSTAHKLAAEKIERYVVARHDAEEYGMKEELRIATADLRAFLHWKFPAD